MLWRTSWNSLQSFSMWIFTITDCSKSTLNREFNSVESQHEIWLWTVLLKYYHVSNMNNFSDRSDSKIYQNVYNKKREWKLYEIRSKTLKIKALKIRFRKWYFWLTKIWECENMITTVYIKIYSFMRTCKAKRVCQIDQTKIDENHKYWWTESEALLMSQIKVRVIEL